MNKKLLEKAFDREFRESGDNFKALCPFHEERTPSFYVHQDENIANCFGCSTHGYIDTLLSRYAGITPEEAREALDINRLEKVTKKKKKDEPVVFPESWLAPFKPAVHKYILERLGNDDETIAILRSLETRYDPVGKRQVFPHRNERGDLFGAVGRTVCGGKPKWLFYWGYKRGRTLYRPFGREFESCILCEGVFDIIRLKQAGVSGCDFAAPIGTKVGRGQLKELKEYKEVIIAFDNDSMKETDSGQIGAEKVYQQLKRSCVCKFIVLPSHINDIGETPINQIQELVDGALNYVSWRALQRTDPSSRVLS